jgi:hypothetical protein
MDRNTEALVAAILTIAKFLPNVTYASETVATEFQQMLEEVRKIRPSPDRAAVPPDRATARRLDDLTSSFTSDELHRFEELVALKATG